MNYGLTTDRVVEWLTGNLHVEWLLFTSERSNMTQETSNTNKVFNALSTALFQLQRWGRRNYKSGDSEDAFKDSLWMTRMCRMWMLATSWYLLYAFICAAVCMCFYILHICVLMQQVRHLPSHQHIYAQITLETLPVHQERGKVNLRSASRGIWPQWFKVHRKNSWGQEML